MPVPNSIHESIAESVTESKDSTVDMVFTPTATEDHLDTSESCSDEPDLPSSSVPWPGSIFIIRSVSTGNVITLLDGEIIMARPGGRGSIHWSCEETKGWLGFRSPISGKYLGHNKQGRFSCFAKGHYEWEYFSPRMSPDGGYVLLMTHWERLWYVEVVEQDGVRKPAKTDRGMQYATIWEFIKV